MVAIAARGPAFFRTTYTMVQHALGGSKRKRDESTHTVPQSSSGMSPPQQRMGLNPFIKRPRTQGCLDDEVRSFAHPSLLSTTPA